MDRAQLEDHVRSFSEKHILVLGDVMLDRFVWGNVERISPESPVPVVEVTHEDFYPGGAANVARNLLPFCGKVSVIGVVGPGADGQKLCEILAEKGVDHSGILVSSDRQTTVKTRVIARSQQVVRIDREDRHPVTDEIRQRALDYLRDHIDGLDAIILQDYGKGFITQELVDGVAEITAGTNLTITVDPNPNNLLDWKGVTAIKPNRHEAFKVAGLPESPISDPPAQDPTLLGLAETLFANWDTEQLLITLSEQGMVLFQKDAAPLHLAPSAHEVFDVSGAGDTAIALFTLALAGGSTPAEAARISNYASGVVVGKIGTATLSKEELINCTSPKA
ncbi:MAG: rfaE bifunctional protein kinase chain/domain [Verrucomicrobiales bacterium]|jgi:rfaE bifunctional protein kinase chain/domain